MDHLARDRTQPVHRRSVHRPRQRRLTPRTRNTAISIPTTPSPSSRHGRTDPPAINPVDSRVNLHGLTPNWSLYFTDTLTLAKTVNVTVSGRYNRLTVDNSDRINPIAGPGSLDGDYVFQRFNPAVGITWSPIPTRECLCELHAGQPRPDGH